MIRITVDVSEETHLYLVSVKGLRGSSISFEANQLIEQSIKEKNRKKNAKKVHISDNATDKC